MNYEVLDSQNVEPLFFIRDEMYTPGEIGKIHHEVGQKSEKRILTLSSYNSTSDLQVDF